MRIAVSSAQPNESTRMSSGRILWASDSSSASATRISRNPVASMNGRRSAGGAGGAGGVGPGEDGRHNRVERGDRRGAHEARAGPGERDAGHDPGADGNGGPADHPPDDQPQ